MSDTRLPRLSDLIASLDADGERNDSLLLNSVSGPSRRTIEQRRRSEPYPSRSFRALDVLAQVAAHASSGPVATQPVSSQDDESQNNDASSGSASSQSTVTESTTMPVVNRPQAALASFDDSMSPPLPLPLPLRSLSLDATSSLPYAPWTRHARGSASVSSSSANSSSALSTPTWSRASFSSISSTASSTSTTRSSFSSSSSSQAPLTFTYNWSFPPRGSPGPTRQGTQPTPEKRFECETCGSRFARRHDLERHKRMHTGERPYACRTCGERFRRSDARKKHEAVCMQRE